MIGFTNSVRQAAINMDEGIQKAKEQTVIFTNDKEKLRAYQMRMMGLSDQVSGINNATKRGERRGERRGIKKGRMERDVEFIKMLHARGDSVEEIADFMSKSIDEVQEILRENIGAIPV